MTYRVASLLFALGIVVNTFAAIALLVGSALAGRAQGWNPFVGLLVVIFILLAWIVSIVYWRVILESFVAIVMAGDFSKRTFDLIDGGHIEVPTRAPTEDEEVSFDLPVSEPSSAQIRRSPIVTESTSLTHLAEYEENPRGWVYSVFTSADIELWMRAGSPNLRPYILEGMPDLRKWLKKNRLL